MTEKIQFRDRIPYPTGSLERRRYERYAVRRTVEELGATNVAVREDDLDSDFYHVFGTIADARADLIRIQSTLKIRGGSSFTQIVHK